MNSTVDPNRPSWPWSPPVWAIKSWIHCNQDWVKRSRSIRGSCEQKKMAKQVGERGQWMEEEGRSKERRKSTETYKGHKGKRQRETESVEEVQTQ